MFSTNSSFVSRSEVQISIYLQVNPKLENLFPNDPYSDITILLGNKHYRLQKAHLRLESQYFNEAFESDKDPNTIVFSKKYDQNIFEKVLRCFYGAKSILSVSEIFQAYDLCQDLKTDSLISLINEEIIKNFGDLNFFSVYLVGYNYNVDEILEKCYMFLRETHFKLLIEDFTYSTSTVTLNAKNPTTIAALPEQAFKNLLKTHNQMKFSSISGTDISYLKNIDLFNILKNYCVKRFDKLQQSEKLKEMVVELIDKNRLTAQEYKIIYHQELVLASEHEEKASIIDSHIVSSSSTRMTNERVITSENFLQKKEMEEMRQENAVLLAELRESKEAINRALAAVKHVEDFKGEMIKQMLDISAEVSKRDLACNTRVLNLENEVSSLKQDMQLKNQELVLKTQGLTQLKIELEELRKEARILQGKRTSQHFSKTVNLEEDSVGNNTLESIIFPKQTKHNNFTAMNKSGSNEDIAFPKGDEMILNPHEITENESFFFTEKRLGLASHLREQEKALTLNPPKSELISDEEYDLVRTWMGRSIYEKIKLQLVFRGTRDGFSAKTFHHMLQGIAPTLVFIRSWDYEKIFGGFTTKPWKDSGGYTPDEQAFIFSLTHKKFFKPKKPEYAVFHSDDYLVSFANDISIGNNCNMEETSSCNFPQDYDCGKEITDTDISVFLAGAPSFQVDEIEVYHVIYEAPMDL